MVKQTHIYRLGPLFPIQSVQQTDGALTVRRDPAIYGGRLGKRTPQTGGDEAGLRQRVVVQRVI